MFMKVFCELIIKYGGSRKHKGRSMEVIIVELKKKKKKNSIN